MRSRSGSDERVAAPPGPFAQPRRASAGAQAESALQLLTGSYQRCGVSANRLTPSELCVAEVARLIGAGNVLCRLPEKSPRKLGVSHHSRQSQRSEHCRQSNQRSPFRGLGTHSPELSRDKVNERQ
jgi:hypothetical protein